MVALEPNAVSVAGLNPGDFGANINAAEAAGKSVRYVSIQAPAGTDNYSVYAQIVHSAKALLVRSYGRIQVYELATVKVVYSANPNQAVDIAALPLVVAKNVDAAFSTNTAIGASSATRARLCSNCAYVLVRPKGVPVVAGLWASAKDPWQTRVDYVFWKAGSDVAIAAANTRALQFLGTGGNCGLSGGLCGSYYPSLEDCPFLCVGLGGGGGGAPPTPAPPQICNRNALPFSRSRSVQSAREISAAKMEAIAAHIAQFSVSDAQVDENIDSQIQGSQREYVKSVMLSMPSESRYHVMGIDPRGQFFSNRHDDYAKKARSKPWTHLNGNMWKNPAGETVTVPSVTNAGSAAKGTSSIRAIQSACSPFDPTDTGEFVRGFACNSPARTFQVTVDASQVGGAPGPSWCMSPGGLGDTGYLIMGPLSSGPAAEGGLQFSTFYSEYELFAKDSEDGNAGDPIPTTLFAQDFFTITFSFTANSWMVTVAPLTQSPVTWIHPNASSIGSLSSWIYKQEASIAQNGSNFTDGSYFGVGSSGNPLFAWSAIANADGFPDPSRAIQIGNSYGIDLHI